MNNFLKRLWSFHINLGYFGGKVRLVLLTFMILTIILTIIIGDSLSLTLPDWVVLVILGIWAIILRTFRSEKDMWDKMEDELDEDFKEND